MKNTMQQISKDNFGIIVAFIIPGFIGTWGLAYISPTIKSWFISQQQPTTSIPALFYVLLSSLAVGMAVSAFRWALIDTIHHHTGIIRPTFKFSHLKEVLQEFETINEHHYRYYQYYANTLIALVGTYAIRCVKLRIAPWNELLLFLGLATTIIILFCASRNSLKQFYIRASQLLGVLEKEVNNMTNGTGTPHKTKINDSTVPKKNIDKPIKTEKGQTNKPKRVN